MKDRKVEKRMEMSAFRGHSRGLGEKDGAFRLSLHALDFKALGK